MDSATFTQAVIDDLKVARVIGGGAEVPWTVQNAIPKVEPEVYATLSRKVRRGLRKQRLAPDATLPAVQQPARFVDASPARAYPTTFMWWDRPFNVGAHIFSHCPRLFVEWAGHNFRSIRSGTARQAYRHTDGMCQHCLMRFQMGYTA